MSELHAKPRSRGRSLFWPAYMLSWAVMAGGALAYLSFNALPSSTQLEALATLPKSAPESNRADVDRERLTAQVRSLNETVSKLRGDLARLKSEKPTEVASAPSTLEQGISRQPPTDSAMPESSRITTSSVAKSEPAAIPPATPDQADNALGPALPPSTLASTVETAPGPTSPNGNEPLIPKIMNAPPGSTPVATEQPTQIAAAQPNQTATAAPRRLRNLATAPLRSGRVPPLPRVNAALANQPPPAAAPQANLPDRPAQQPYNTAKLPIANSVAPPAPATGASSFGVSTVTQRPLPAAAALSLSTAQSVTGLRASWLLLTSRHPQTFSQLQPRYIADQANSTYRLLAGPIPTHAEADRICTELRAQSVSCGVTSYVGSALQ